jgi:hypothetical protein
MVCWPSSDVWNSLVLIIVLLLIIFSASFLSPCVGWSNGRNQKKSLLPACRQKNGDWRCRVTFHNLSRSLRAMCQFCSSLNDSTARLHIPWCNLFFGKRFCASKLFFETGNLKFNDKKICENHRQARLGGRGSNWSRARPDRCSWSATHSWSVNWVSV